jgi:hypothetical protein
VAQPLRIEYPGAVYHLTSRGDGREDVFLDDRDRERFFIMNSHPSKRTSAADGRFFDGAPAETTLVSTRYTASEFDLADRRAVSLRQIVRF